MRGCWKGDCCKVISAVKSWVFSLMYEKDVYEDTYGVMYVRFFGNGRRE